MRLTAARETSVNPAVVRELIGMDGIRMFLLYPRLAFSRLKRSEVCDACLVSARTPSESRELVLPASTGSTNLIDSDKAESCSNHIPFIITSLTSPNISKKTL